MPDYWWTVPRKWDGQPCAIVAGGPSLAGYNVDRLRGVHVIAVNSSWKRVPFADYLIFGDTRWWYEYGTDAAANFPGQIVTLEEEAQSERINHPRLLKLKKRKPPGLAIEPDSAAMQWTSLSAALNLARHLGPNPITLFGADGGPSLEGKTHHHAPHPWGQVPDNWARQRDELRAVASSLSDAGVSVRNASPGSALSFWPIIPFDQAF